MEGVAGPSTVNSTPYIIYIPPPYDETIETNTDTDHSVYFNIESDFKWMPDSVSYLIHLVSIHHNEFYDKTIKKKILWKKIAEEMKAGGFQNCTSDHCDKKWRNLKKTYQNILEKKVEVGDCTSKFIYFNQIHAFLGREIDPIQIREPKCYESIHSNNIRNDDEFPRIPFFEITEDDNFSWSASAVHKLIDLILEHKDIFLSNKDTESVWEGVANKMSDGSYYVQSLQCQKKWSNLNEGFRHHQAEAEATGIPPKWEFFDKVKSVITTFNVPFLVPQDLRCASNIEGTLTIPFHAKDLKFSSVEMNRQRNRYRAVYMGRKRDKYVRKMNDELPQNFSSVLKCFQRLLNIKERISHFESRVATAQKIKKEGKDSNNRLNLILGELKRINRSIEDGKNRLKEQEKEKQRNERIILNHVDPSGSIFGGAVCAQGFLDINTQDLANFAIFKTPQIEWAENSKYDADIKVEQL